MTSVAKTPLKINEKLLRNLPLLIKNGQIRLQGHVGGPKVVLKKIQVVTEPTYRQDVIYDSLKHGLLKGESRGWTIVNFFNTKLNISKTVAKFKGELRTEERTSDSIVQLIGQKNYETVLTALCSVLDQDIKVRSILALLTPAFRRSKCDKSTQMDPPEEGITDSQNSPPMSKYRKRIRRKVGPFAVKGKEPKKITINPQEVIDEAVKKREEVRQTLSRTSSWGNLSLLSGYTDRIPDENTLLNNIDLYTSDTFDLQTDNSAEIAKNIKNSEEISNDLKRQVIATNDMNSIQNSFKATNIIKLNNDIRNFNPTTIKLYDNTEMMLPTKPEDCFHVATPEILKNIYANEQRKLISHQAFIDFTLCLQTDEDNNLPIHLSVINNDVELLKRHCLMLKLRKATVDVLGDGDMTALHLSIRHNSSPECTLLLLRHGADILFCGPEKQNALHMAATADHRHLEVIIKFARENARKILQQNSDLWKESYQNTDDEELINVLFRYFSTQFEGQDGHTPLTLACKSGSAANVKLLVNMCPETINTKALNSGNTALYEAVTAACLDAEERSNKSAPSDNFKEILSLLIKNKADPAIENFSCNNIHSLLQEAGIPGLSLFLATAITSANISEINQSRCKPELTCRPIIIKVKPTKLPKKAPPTFDRTRKIVDIAKNIILTDVNETTPVFMRNSTEAPILISNDNIRVLHETDAKRFVSEGKLKRKMEDIVYGESKVIKTELV